MVPDSGYIEGELLGLGTFCSNLYAYDFYFGLLASLRFCMKPSGGIAKDRGRM